MENKMNFGQAIDALKNGSMLSRKNWEDVNSFIFKQIPANISLDIIPKMQSVPQSVKDEMIKRSQTLKYSNQIVIVSCQGKVDTYTASASDILSNDWFIYE